MRVIWVWRDRHVGGAIILGEEKEWMAKNKPVTDVM